MTFTPAQPFHAPPHLTDQFHRTVSYLRVSVTDRCNLRCRYCMTGETRWLPKHAILTLEELHRVVSIGAGLGIDKVRLTGGEPLCRRGIVDLVANICRIPGLDDIALTTNGTLLAGMAQPLARAGLGRINISLDTLDTHAFGRITGRDLWEDAWQGITSAQAAGMAPVKINTVVMRGVNDDQIKPLALLTRQYPFHVRFIEYMPIGIDPRQGQPNFMAVDEIQMRVAELGELLPIDHQPSDGPAQRFRLAGAAGEIGLIGSMSAHFCSRCNRIRLTADGHLRPCLLSDDQVDLITPLRRGATDDDIAALFAETTARKQGGHRLRFNENRRLRSKMAGIGG
ncbi:MAG: GTP 3',8-cyclase MoaA [Desulfatitalea sp.]|nr:GTP 3',8-cyclase MoaA [Desulfatitalea sp.]NNK02058.1 GTP 3',8-cyclase MoaA [Desulfatitalea sp.]